MTVQAAAPAEQAHVVWLDWEDYLRWLSGKLRATSNASGERVKLGAPLAPGHHMPIVGPTGCAKTTHAVGFVNSCRKYVLALDPKGEDETLSASGYIRVTSLPEGGWKGLRSRLMDKNDQRAWKEIYERIDAGQPARVIVGGGARTDNEDIALRDLMRDAITFSRHSGGWTLFVDEFELLSSQRMMKLGDMIERMLITARRDKTSVITTFQAPAWVSKHSTRQGRKAVVYPQSANMVKNIAGEMNWDWRELAAVLDMLPDYHTATIGRGPRQGPIVITQAPKLPDKPQKPASSRDAGRP